VINRKTAEGSLRKMGFGLKILPLRELRALRKSVAGLKRID